MSSGQSAFATSREELDRIKWQPIPGSTQEFAIETQADQTLFCGTRGCGKTAAQLMCFRSYVGVGYGSAWCGIIFDTEYKPLVNIINQSKKFYEGLGDGAVFHASKADQYWEWPGGEQLYFRAAKSIDDARNYLGHEYAFIGYNELSKWPNSDLYDHMMGSLRASSNKDIHCKVFSTTNPYGPGVTWIRERFINPAPYGMLVEERFDVDMGNGKFEEVTKTKIAVRGNYQENPFFKKEDVASLMEGVRDRPEMKAAWLYCDWDASYLDGALGDLWNRDVHLLPNFKIPSTWRVNRSFDWGSATPFAVCWFAESNDEEFEVDGEKRRLPNGSIVLFYEWYGSQSGRLGRNRGSRLAPDQIAFGVSLREKNFVVEKILPEGITVWPGPADTQISDISRVDIASIEAEMAKHGVTWEKADKSPGSRRQGLQMLRQALRNAVEGESAGFYVMARCENSISLLPSLERDIDKEDIAKGQEDHLYDCIRYRVSQANLGVPDVKFTYW